jgi:phosphate-selective porin OprO and OprP
MSSLRLAAVAAATLASSTALADDTVKIGGYTHFDGRFFVGDDDQKNTDQFTFRRIRPELGGTLLGRADYKLLLDFAGGRAVVQDAYLDLKAADELRFQLGKFKEPFGLERLQSAKDILFVERGLPTQIAPNRDVGITVHGDIATKVAYYVGVFDGVADGGSTDGDVSDDKDLAARVFVTPVDGLGLGVATTWGKNRGTLTTTDLPQLKTSGQATFFQYRTGMTLDDTAVADGAHARWTGQGYYYRGPAGVLAEYVRSTQRVSLGAVARKVTSQAWQVAASVVVVGGTPSYKGVTVDRPFDPSKRQYGAVELAARYNEAVIGDEAFEMLADPTKSARGVRAFGLGANWHLSRAVKLDANYELTTFEGGAADDGDRPTEHVVLGRVQTVF